MSFEDLNETRRPELARGQVCVLIATSASDSTARRCVESVMAHTAPEVLVTVVERSARAVNRALALVAPADAVLLDAPCLVGEDWLARMRDAAYGDTTTATASALASDGTALALADASACEPASACAVEHSMRLRPRLGVIVGPCVYLRRDALELAGEFDEQLELSWALRVDYAQRCLLSGLAHVAADDAVVVPLERPEDSGGQLPRVLRERYPYLSEPPAVAASETLPRALEAARRPRARLPVTVDVRALDGAITGTQRHILELVRALADTEQLQLRLLTSPGMSATEEELLRSLPGVELLAFEEIDEDTRASIVFHRPQQVFGPADMRVALRLGERIVMSQLDLIAYRNPGYHRRATEWHSHRRVTRQALAAADRVVVSSAHTRAELLSDELTDGDRIRVVPPGLDHIGAADEPRKDDEAKRDEHPDGFLLCLGTDFRHKNRLFALRMLAEMRTRHDWRGGLVLAGTHIPYGSSHDAERELIERHALEEAVSDLGAIGEREKDALMRGARAVIYPSVYEGFGLIPFEAALSGVPCAFAAQSSLRDVLPAEAAIIVPWDPRESAARLLSLLRDDAARARHLELLVRAAERHTWAAAAAAMLDVYREAAVSPAREAATLSRDELDRERELRELVAAQDELVARLVFERKHTQGMYDRLHTQVGFGLGLIGPDGALPEDVQRALLALSAQRWLSAPLYSVVGRCFRLLRLLGRKMGNGS
jgi:glycosyltransferase involved in cell wall biosynthesis